jgi:hypothetical protein
MFKDNDIQISKEGVVTDILETSNKYLESKLRNSNKESDIRDIIFTDGFSG